MYTSFSSLFRQEGSKIMVMTHIWLPRFRVFQGLWLCEY